MGRVAMKLTGKKFGHLTVIRQMTGDEKLIPVKNSVWLCKCDCGKEKQIVSINLTLGRTKSCGCRGADRVHKKTKNNTIRVEKNIHRKVNGNDGTVSYQVRVKGEYTSFPTLFQAQRWRDAKLKKLELKRDETFHEATKKFVNKNPFLFRAWVR